MGLKFMARDRHSRAFPSVSGKLLKADIAYSSDRDSSGYTPIVEFEYTVDGATYQSRQLTAISASTLKSTRNKVQPEIDRLRAEPTVKVYYDPQAPWDGFLRHGPAWGAVIPLVMGAAFMSPIVFIFLAIMRH